MNMSAIDRVNRSVSALKASSSTEVTTESSSSDYIVATAGAADHLDGIKIEVPNDIVSISALKLNEVYDKITHLFLVDCPNLQIDLAFAEALYSMHNLRQIDLSGTTMQAVDNIEVLTPSSTAKTGIPRLVSNYALIHVAMPDLYTQVASSSFHDCSNLLSFSAGQCVSIEDNAFQDCYHLFNINVPLCETIGEYGLAGTLIQSLELEHCTSLGNYALENCSVLKRVSLPACTTLGAHAFSGCITLKTLDLSSCTKLPEYALQNCSSLSNLTLSYSCKTVGQNAFENCTSLKN